MEWIDGMHLKEFLETNPSREVKQRAARVLWELYEHQIHQLRRVNADPHPGNFLFREDGTVGILDFGCTKVLTDDLYNDYFLLARPDLFDDPEKAEETLLSLEILRPSDSPEKRKYLRGLFQRLITLIATPYHEGKFYFNNDEFYEELTSVGAEISRLRELRGSKDYLFINRTYFGLYAIFQQLDAELETTCKFHDFLRKKS
jgi:predicted unusual protein kinase regulating ubiquinone biosynthesis (AarF/ABC1/UbiB family)